MHDSASTAASGAACTLQISGKIGAGDTAWRGPQQPGSVKLVRRRVEF